MIEPAMAAKASGKTVATALWYVGPRECVLNEVELAKAGPQDCVVRTLWSGVSRGTERLVFEGRVPVSEHERMRAPFQEGAFPFPVKYGYCAVGIVEAGPAHLLGETVFCLYPHQDRFVVPASRLALVPKAVPARRAVLAANMETALNAHWDAGSGPADRIVVVGGGVLGLLTAFISAQLPGAEVTLVDLDPARAALAETLGFGFAQPPDCPGEADLVFHAKRLQLVSSQVGQVSPSRRPRFDYARRTQAALALLADERLDALISEEIGFRDAPARLPALFAGNGITAVLRY